MHIFDPNGSIKQYRRERERRETIRCVLFALACAAGIFAAVCVYQMIGDLK
jgi:hypothetical protein